VTGNSKTFNLQNYKTLSYD